MSDEARKTMPVQAMTRDRKPAHVGVAVAMQAYEVYSHVYGPQQALIEGSCRGGFSTGELVAFLYAYPFPRGEWRQRVDEAFASMHLT